MIEGDFLLKKSTMKKGLLLLHEDTITAIEMTTEDTSTRVLSTPKTLIRIMRNPG